jgi:hypothetical protein
MRLRDNRHVTERSIPVRIDMGAEVASEYHAKHAGATSYSRKPGETTCAENSQKMSVYPFAA